MLTKAAVIKAASMFGLVCGTVTTTYVAHKPLHKAVEHVKRHIRHSPPKNPVKRSSEAPRPIPTCIPARIEPQLNMGPIPVPITPPDSIFRSVPAVSRNNIPDTPIYYHPVYPIGGGGFVFIHSPPTIPEPSSWAMMILGIGIVGEIARNKRKYKARQ